jgi:hypothetical protein
MEENLKLLTSSLKDRDIVVDLILKVAIWSCPIPKIEYALQKFAGPKD